MTVVAILGTGVMGGSVASGLVRSGHRAQDLLLTCRGLDRGQELAQRLGAKLVGNAEAAAAADAVIVTVKPQDMGEVLDEVAEHLRPGTVVVSMAAGITTGWIAQRVPESIAVVRAMPNTPARVGKSVTAVSPGPGCTPEQVAVAAQLLESCGKVVVLDEKHQDAVTALSGSGPAYLFYTVEAMIEAGVLLGLPRHTATELVVQTVVGSATLLDETGEHPTVMREQVSSPGGTSMAALRQLDDHKVRAAFVTAIEAAARRSGELSAGQL